MLTKILSVLSLLGLLWGGIATSLYLSTSKDLKASTIKVESLEKDIKSCIEDNSKKEQSSSVTEVISTDNTTKIQSLEKENKSLLSRLNNLPSKVNNCTSTGEKKDGEADIDDRLPSELISLLSERVN